MKRVFIVLLCTFFSFTMLFALDSSTAGNVSLNVAIDSVAIGFVNSVDDAKNATASTLSTSHSVVLKKTGTEFDYSGSMKIWFYWKIMTSETNLKVSLTADGPLILKGKDISTAADYQKIDYKISVTKSDAITWMGQSADITSTITGSKYATDSINITIKDSTKPQIYTQGICELNLSLLEQIKTKAYGQYGCKLTLTVTNI